MYNICVSIMNHIAMRNYQVQGNLFIDESRLCELLIVAPLPDHIKEQVSVFKEEFAQIYGSFNSQYSVPHITVCDFLLFEHRAFDVYSFFKQRLRALPPISVRVNGFNAFLGSNTIHLEVDKEGEYSSLLAEMDNTRRMMRLRKNYFQSNHPHITVAKNIPHDIYEEAKEVFLKRNFAAEFQIGRLEVLKFDLITRRYKLYGTLPFTGY